MASRGQSIVVAFTAWDTSANAGKTGDAANFTLRWIKDGTSAVPTNAPATEVDATNAPGIYKITLTTAECTCDFGLLAGKSGTANVSIIPVAVAFEQLPTAAPNAASGLITSGTGTGQISLASGLVTLAAVTHAGATIPTVTTLTNLPSAPTDWISSASVSAAAVTKVQAGLATPTNITAGTITTVTTLTNLPAITTDWLTGTGVAASAVTKIQAGLATPTNITAGTITTVTTTTNLTNLPSAPTDWLSAAAVSAAAVTKVQAGLATSAQIPANFTTATFASAGVFATAALANAPTGGSAPTAAAIRAEIDSNSTGLAAIYARLGAPAGASLAADVATRLATAGYTAPPSAATVASTLLGTAGLTVRALDAIADAALTVGDCLVAAACGAAGKESVAGTAYVVKTPSTGTTIRTFTLDDATTPTSRS